jgi:hypothetical protein
MFNLPLVSVVNKMVEHELVGNGRDDEALHFHFDLRLAYYLPKGYKCNASAGLHLLYHLNKGYSYVSVFSAITESPFTKIAGVTEWKHETTHDSCWRELRTVVNLYFQMAEEINLRLKSSGHKEVAPCEMTEHNNFALFGKLYQWVPVQVTKDPSDKHNYRKLITINPK